jgi:transposase-like protein
MSVNIPVVCRHCGSQNVVKFGRAPNGKQKYRCHTCGRQSRERPDRNGYAPEQRDEILRAYNGQTSIRGLERTFGVHRNTIISWLRKDKAS